MKKTIILLCFLICGAKLFSQGLKTNDYTTNYFTQKTYFEHYLDSIHSIMSDSLFYSEGSEYSQMKRWESDWEDRLPDGDFQNYFNVTNDYYNRTSGRSLFSPYYPSVWKEIGPTDKPSGDMSGSNSSSGIGPVDFIRFYKNDTSHLLCGSMQGGLFYSSDGGENWVNAGTDFWGASSSAVTWAEFNVNDPTIVYAASGWSSDCVPGIISGGGIYRSAGGSSLNPSTTWTLIADNSQLGVTTNCIIYKLLTDPYNYDWLYVATSEGLFKSENVNDPTPFWFPFGGTSPILSGNVFDIEMHPGTGGNLKLYASKITTTSPEFWVSTDGGQHWTQINSSDLPPAPGTPNQISIEVSDAFPNNIYLYYYSTNICDNTSKNIYRYDLTHSYTHINSSHVIDDYCLTCSCPQCFGSGTAFAVSQAGTDEIILVADGLTYTRFLYSTASSTFIVAPQINTYNNTTNNYDFHSDMEAFTFNPYSPSTSNPNEGWMACHGGPFKSYGPEFDNITTAPKWQGKMKGVGVAHVKWLAEAYSNPEDILIANFHDGAILTTGAYSNNWNPNWEVAMDGGDGIKTMVDSKDPTNMYASHQPGGCNHWYTSKSGGSLIIPFTCNFATNLFFDLDWGPSPSAINKVETNFIYGRNSGREVYRTNNYGVSGYQTISNIQGKEGSTGHLGGLYTFEDNSDLLIAGFYVVAGTNAGNNLYYMDKATTPLSSIDVEADWHLINFLHGGTRYIKDVEMDPENNNNIYVAVNMTWPPPQDPMIYKVENFRDAFPTVTPLHYNLPQTGIGDNPLVLEKGSNGGIYFSMDMGIFYTNNKRIADYIANPTLNPDVWIKLGGDSDFPHLRPNGIEINYPINRIRAAINGRGIWETDLVCPSATDLTESITYPADDYLEAENDITSTAIVNSGINMTYRAGDEIVLSDGFNAYSGSNFKAFIHACNHSGNSFRSHSGGGFKPEDDDDESKPIRPLNSINIIPNPNNGTFQITISKNDKPIGIRELKIMDMMGRIVWQIGASQNNIFNVDISQYAQGIYYVRTINEDGEIQMQKLIKE